MKKHEERPQENNPETGTNNVFRRGQLPEEAGDQAGTPVSGKPLSDKGNLGREGSMKEQFASEEGYHTMDDDESEEGLGGRLPGDEPGVR